MKTKRRITANTKTNIQELVRVTADFLPFSAYKNQGTTFLSIFKESNVHKYIPEKVDSKKQKLHAVWENILRYHPRLPFIIIRKIVPAAIEYRRSKRNPIKAEEIEALIACLEKLGIDMRRELSQIDIDESLPEIVVPPKELVQRLENHPLSIEISGEPLDLFRNGHFNESVRKASERFEVRVQNITGETDIGKSLMGKVFKVNAPIIVLNTLSSENEKGIQEGYQLMTMGMMRDIRNVFSHGDENQRSPEECYEMLLFINWLFRQLPS